MNTGKNIKVAILGRPNVGKSTLFNLLSLREKAIVHSEAGVTRDARLTPAKLFDLFFDLIDTAGVEPGVKDLSKEKNVHANSREALASNLNLLSERAAAEADILLLMIDGQAGVLPADETLAHQFRSLNKPLYLVMNKADTKVSYETAMEALSLGLGDAAAISAAHHSGMENLYDILREHIEPTVEIEPDVAEDSDEPMAISDEVEERTVRKVEQLPFAIVGRPNVGKSTFVNKVLGEERMLAGNIAGLTRESIGTPFNHNGQDLIIVDTPGLRKRAKVTETLENMSTSDAIKAVRSAEAVLLILDASAFSVAKGTTDIFEQQDARIAEFAVKEGKPLVIALNKWDLVEDKDGCLEDVRYQMNSRFSQVQNIPLVPLSAERGKGVNACLDTLLEVHEKSSTQLPTALLNRFLEVALNQKAPPLVKGKSVKLKFMTQTGINPPAFRIYGNRVNTIPGHYQRYLLNQMREAFDLGGIPLRLYFKSGQNPYTNR